MDKGFIDAKSMEHLSRAILAIKQGDNNKKRRALRNLLIFERIRAREAVKDLEVAIDTRRGFMRSATKAKCKGITSPLFDARGKQLRDEIENARERLISTGEALSGILDLWQHSGATLRDLCNLCNRDYEWVLNRLGEHAGDEFSKIVFVYNLDYKSSLGYLDYSVDAPLTHAMKEYMLDVMLNTEDGRRASREAMEKFFPEILENAMTLVTLEDGTQHLIDKDGNDMGPVEWERGL